MYHIVAQMRHVNTMHGLLPAAVAKIICKMVSKVETNLVVTHLMEVLALRM